MLRLRGMTTPQRQRWAAVFACRYHQGESMETVACAYDTSVSMVRILLIEAGVTIRPSAGRQYTPEQRAARRAQAITLYAQPGATLASVAAAIGDVTPPTISRWLPLSTTPPPPLQPPNRQET
jgi:hypothetical protein